MALAGKSTADRRLREAHSWISTETVNTRLGAFEFRNGYPEPDTVRRLRDALAFNRAIEVYLAQMPVVSWYHVWKGVAKAGIGAPNQMVIWESLMDAQNILLTGNSETVYGLCAIDLRRDGPVVIEAPAMMLGGINDLWQHEIMGIGPTGADKGKGGKFLLLPPGYKDPVPDGYLVGRSRSYEVVLGVRGFLTDGKPDHAVALMKTTKVYPFTEILNPPQMRFVNGSYQPIDTVFSDTYPVLRGPGLADRPRAGGCGLAGGTVPACRHRHRTAPEIPARHRPAMAACRGGAVRRGDRTRQQFRLCRR